MPLNLRRSPISRTGAAPRPGLMAPRLPFGTRVRRRLGGPADPAELGTVAGMAGPWALVAFADRHEWVKTVKLEPAP